MADFGALKKSLEADRSGEDPLAELTRIMGLGEEARAVVAEYEDFGVDLEKELLGDFAFDDEPVEPIIAMSSPVRSDAVDEPAGLASADSMDRQDDVDEVLEAAIGSLDLEEVSPEQGIADSPVPTASAASDDELFAADVVEQHEAPLQAEYDSAKQSIDHSASTADPFDNDLEAELAALLGDAPSRASLPASVWEGEASPVDGTSVEVEPAHDLADDEIAAAEYLPPAAAEAVGTDIHGDLALADALAEDDVAASVEETPSTVSVEEFEPAPVAGHATARQPSSADPFSELAAMAAATATGVAFGYGSLTRRPNGLASQPRPVEPTPVPAASPVFERPVDLAPDEAPAPHVTTESVTETSVDLDENLAAVPDGNAGARSDSYLDSIEPEEFLAWETSQEAPAASISHVPPTPQPQDELESITADFESTFDDMIAEIDRAMNPSSLPEASDAQVSAAHGRGHMSQAAPIPSSTWSQAAPVSSSAWSQPAARAEPMEVDLDLETVEVPQSAFDNALDLNVPDLPVHEEPSRDVPLDGFEDDFADAFRDLMEDHPAPANMAASAQAVQTTRTQAYQFEPVVAAAGVAAMGATAHARQTEPAPAQTGQDWSEISQGYDQQPAAGYPDDAYPDQSDYPEGSAYQNDEEPRASARRPSRGLLVAGIVGGIAVLGGIGAFAFSGGGSGSDPVLVRADPSPIKVRPENPGGTVVPNQDKMVYDRVSAGEQAAAPVQEQLQTSSEEPVDLAATAPAPSMMATSDDPIAEIAKSEDRLEPELPGVSSAAPEEIIAVEPRRVRTMIVRPDGTLVPREEGPAVSPADLAAAAPPQPALAPLPGANGTVEPVVVASAPAAAAPAAPPEVRSVQTQTLTPDTVTGSVGTPSSVPAAPSRPAEQPIEIVGSTGATPAPQVAALSQEVPAQAGGWTMQIASQPTREGAQATYVDLARRYGSILEGRGVNIVRADIPDRGTYWRVRVPAQSREDANTLCTRYKAAGGSCFVSR